MRKEGPGKAALPANIPQERKTCSACLGLGGWEAGGNLITGRRLLGGGISPLPQRRYSI